MKKELAVLAFLMGALACSDGVTFERDQAALTEDEGESEEEDMVAAQPEIISGAHLVCFDMSPKPGAEPEEAPADEAPAADDGMAEVMCQYMKEGEVVDVDQNQVDLAFSDGADGQVDVAVRFTRADGHLQILLRIPKDKMADVVVTSSLIVAGKKVRTPARGQDEDAKDGVGSSFRLADRIQPRPDRPEEKPAGEQPGDDQEEKKGGDDGPAHPSKIHLAEAVGFFPIDPESGLPILPEGVEDIPPGEFTIDAPAIAQPLVITWSPSQDEGTRITYQLFVLDSECRDPVVDTGRIEDTTYTVRIDLEQDREYCLKVMARDGQGNGGTATNNGLTFHYQRPTMGFLPLPVRFGDDYQGVGVGDFNGDGKPDLVGGFRIREEAPAAAAAPRAKKDQEDVPAECRTPITMAKHKRKGPVKPSVVPIPGRCHRAGIGRPGERVKPDRAAFREGVGIRLGRGDGSFEEMVEIERLPVRKGLYFATCDVGGDGKLDLLVEGHGGVLLFSGKGDGTFQKGETVTRRDPMQLACGDVNGDGYADLMLAPTGHQNIRLGKADGSFGTAQNFATSKGRPTGYTLAELTGDNKPELVVSYWTAKAQVFSFSNSQLRSLGHPGSAKHAQDFAAGDFDGDGDLDLYHPAYFSDFIYLNDGDGTFGAAKSVGELAGKANGWAGVPFDADGDGHLDLLAIYHGNDRDKSISQLLYRGRGDGTFHQDEVMRFGEGGNHNTVFAADVDGDGHLDAIFGVHAEKAPVVHLFRPGRFGQPSTSAAASSPSQ